MAKPHDPSYNRDEDARPGGAGEPQRPATEPRGSAGSSRSDKTLTDPASGEPTSDGHAPNRAKTDQTDGVKPKAQPPS